MQLLLGLDETRLATFCQAHHISKLSLFGSQLKGTARVDSDVDLLVEFDTHHIPNLFDLTRMEAEISDLMGKKVDLRTAGDLSRYFRSQVMATAVPQYAACRPHSHHAHA
jgi:predicted nucleotidyltransferase